MFTKESFGHSAIGMLNIALPLTLGFILHNYWLGVMGAFGTLLFMYYVPSNEEKTFSQNILVSLIGIISFPISAVMSTIPWLSLLWIGILAYIIQYALTGNKFIGPGAFFLMIINSMLSSLHHYPFHQVLAMSFFTYIGIFTSLMFSMLEPILLRQPHTFKLNFDFQTGDLQIATKSLIYGIFTFLANFIGFNLHLPNYYWLLIGAMAVLQAENVIHARTRQIQYVIGSIVGCTLSLLAYMYIHDRMTLAILAIICIGIICITINRSYMVGNFFTTPVALLLFKSAVPNLSDNLIGFRIMSLVIGTVIGLIGILYFDHLMKKEVITNMLKDSLD